MSKVYLVGSILYKKNPRDIDVVMIVSDRLFTKLFKISVADWMEQGKTGKWSAGRYRWSKFCTKMCKALAKDSNVKKMIDFKIQPLSYSELFRNRKRVRIA